MISMIFDLVFFNCEQCFPKTTAQAICMYLSNAWTLIGRDKDKLFHFHTNDLWIIIKLFPFEWKPKKMYSVFGAFFVHYYALQKPDISVDRFYFSHILSNRENLDLVMYIEVVFCCCFFLNKSSFLMCSLQSLMQKRTDRSTCKWIKNSLNEIKCDSLGLPKIREESDLVVIILFLQLSQYSQSI